MSSMSYWNVPLLPSSMEATSLTTTKRPFPAIGGCRFLIAGGNLCFTILCEGSPLGLMSGHSGAD